MYGIPGLLLLLWDRSFGLALGLPFLIASLVYLLKFIWLLRSPAPEEAQGLERMEALQYKHFYDGTGIAVDPKAQQLHLYLKPTYKVYPFSEVRRWEVSSVRGGVIVGGGAAGAAATISSSMKANKDSGLFIDVKDIEMPRWRVAFDRRKEDKEHPKWMEILRQSINND